MSDTPRTDAALKEINGSVWVHASVAMNLEKELLAKNQVIKNLEYTIKEVRAEWGVLKQRLDSSRNYTQFLFDNAAKEQKEEAIWKMRAVALQDLIHTAVAALNDYPLSQDAQMGLLVALAKAIDDPILEHVKPSAPPVDNAHVAEGCEKFSEDTQLPERKA